MTPIPFLSTASVAAGASGMPASNVAAGMDFAALLPGGVAPVMPRQGDAEGGNGLPARDRDEVAMGDAAAIWVTPPLWPAVSVPVDVAKGEGGASVPNILLGEGRVPSGVGAPVAPLVQPVRGDVVAGDTSPVGQLGAAVVQPVRTDAVAAGEGADVALPIAPLVQPIRGDQPQVAVVEDIRAPLPPLVQTTRAGEVSLDTVTTARLGPGLRRGAGAAVAAPVGVSTQPGAGVTIPSQPGLFPGEGRGPVAASPAVQTPVAPLVQPVRDGDAPVATVSQLDPGLRRGTVEAGAVATPAAQVKIAAPQSAAELQPLTPTRIAPASQMFAAAIQRAVRDERRPAAGDAIASLTGTTTATTHTAAIDLPQTPLNMARETWPTRMIERIEVLRDMADATDTSIRLVPDKLGAIDVSLKRDGDTVQVQLNAHQPETRQLLAEAQPKLTDMAEARGLRLSTQTGDGSAGGQQPQQQRAATITTPRRATADRPAETADDERIA